MSGAAPEIWRDPRIAVLRRSVPRPVDRWERGTSGLLGNAPHMRAERGSDASQIVFRFTRGDNMKSPQDLHMHDVTITFLDKDHVQSEWVSYENGKSKETKKFDLVRKKS